AWSGAWSSDVSSSDLIGADVLGADRSTKDDARAAPDIWLRRVMPREQLAVALREVMRLCCRRLYVLNRLRQHRKLPRAPPRPVKWRRVRSARIRGREVDVRALRPSTQSVSGHRARGESSCHRGRSLRHL